MRHKFPITPTMPHLPAFNRSACTSSVSVVLGAVLLLIGTIRLLGLVLHTPVIGYANNFDMVRIQSCHQIWPADRRIPATASTPGAPLESYTFGGRIPFPCIYSSELIFTSIGVGAVRMLQLLDLLGDQFSIRIFGAVRGLCLVLLAWWFFHWCVSVQQTLTACVHCWIFGLVIADPANTLYLNTFYSEFSALYFGYMACLLFYRLSFGKPSMPTTIAFAAALFLLGGSKPQHAALPIAIVAAFAVVNSRRMLRSQAMIPIIGSALVVWAQAHYRQAPAMFAIARANATDTFLATVLPAATDPHAAARTLGLPDSCVAHMGKSWYTRGVQLKHPCPEVFNASRAQIPALIARDPKFLARVTAAAIAQLRPWCIKSLGSVGDSQRGQAVALYFSLSPWLDRLPLWILPVLFVSFLAAGGAAGFLVAVRGRHVASRAASMAFLFACSASTVFYSSVFGDGLSEFAKHTHLFFSFATSFVIVVASAAAAGAVRFGCAWYDGK